MTDYVLPEQLKGISRHGPVVLSEEQTRMVYLMLGLTPIGHDVTFEAKYFWFHGRGYGKTTTLLTAARYAEAANYFWDHGFHSSSLITGMDVEFLVWYINNEDHI